MQKAYFEYDGYKVHYTLIGNGAKHLLAFNGYGQEGAVYKAFENSLGREYTIIAFDLFHHGESHYPRGLAPDTALELDLFKEMLESLLNRMGIDTFGLMGYSMGGRICLQLLTMFGNRVTELYLFAPDGIKRSNGYAFGTYTLVGKALFKLMVDTGGIMLAGLKLGNRLGIVNSKAHAFFVIQVNTKEKRRKLYNTWQTYRRFKPNLDTVAAILNTGQVKLHLFTGKYDKVLPPWTVNRLLKKLTINTVNNQLQSGHDLISLKTSAYLERYVDYRK